MENIIDDLRPEDHLKTADRIAFVGPNSDYYINAWEKFENGKVLSMNWGAFLFGIGWCLYRKMYVETAVLIGLLAIETFLEEYIISTTSITEFGPYLTLAINLSIATIIGLFANKYYMQFADRKIAAIKNEIGNRLDYDIELSKAGGTSVISMIIGLVVLVLLLVYLIP